MSDESIDDLLAGLDAAVNAEGGTIESTGGDLDADVGETTPSTGRKRGRISGVLALMLGVIGSAVAVLAALLSIRFGLGAADAVDRTMAPIDEAVGRLETRIDQTDDLAGGDIPTERRPEVEARVDGLVDLSTGARQAAQRIDDQPILGRLPVDLGGLVDELAWFEEKATGLDPGDGPAMADDLNEMQARVSGLEDRIDRSNAGLRRWSRLAALAGFFGSLWGLWAQSALARQGWRRLRG